MKFNLSDENKTLLINGAKSLAWRTGAFAAVGVINLLTQMNMPAEYQLVLGLIAGEVTKFINRKYQLGQERKTTDQ